MIDGGMALSGGATAICCAVELHRFASMPRPRGPGKRASAAVVALADMPPEPPCDEHLGILNRLGDRP